MILLQIFKDNKLFLIVKMLLMILFILLISILNNQILENFKRAEDIMKSVSKINYEYGIKFERYDELLNIPVETKINIINEISELNYITVYYHERSVGERVIALNTTYAQRLKLKDDQGNSLKSGCAYLPSNDNVRKRDVFFNSENIESCGRLDDLTFFLTSFGKISTNDYSIIVSDPFFTYDGMNGTLAFSDSISFSFDTSKKYTSMEIKNMIELFQIDFDKILEKNSISSNYFLVNNSAGYTSAMKYIQKSFEATKVETICLILLLIVYSILATYYFRYKNLRLYAICITQGVSKFSLVFNETVVNSLIFLVSVCTASLIMKLLNIPILLISQLTEIIVLVALSMLLTSYSVWKLNSKEVLEQCSSRKE
ncbi:MAG: hypothetical protein RR738_10405 [Anaerorhabdus sp.]|uniref:hypothetical protein n=1 Tax=Anaerorhabdus sp. TaxID=1872524 RepID=UPI002B1EF06C|nr:hypothetical protein [Anaerorhabdus sp.]MEA4874310.1 hypothetical protein [Anaerorhabdus sp.]